LKQIRGLFPDVSHHFNISPFYIKYKDFSFPFKNKYVTFLLELLIFLFCFFEVGSPYVAQAGLELKIFLLLPPECRDCRHVPPLLVPEKFIHGHFFS
jgi:hypothetical protein